MRFLVSTVNYAVNIANKMSSEYTILIVLWRLIGRLANGLICAFGNVFRFMVLNPL